ncbi:MAG TPA: cyclopropane-fatty-acyl-phospholipid synthase family protein [Vicinamibacterales bacterium]
MDTSVGPAFHSAGSRAESVESATTRDVSRRVTRVDRWLATRLQQRIRPSAVRLVLWDGQPAGAAPERAIGDLYIRDRATLLGLIVHPDLRFGEAYMAGRVEVRGRLDEIVEALTGLSRPRPSLRNRLAVALASRNTTRAGRRNVHRHYDLGNDFYASWLDPQLVYTCAYYPDPSTPLDAAQVAKLDLVCRKLQIKPGDRVIEAGCGWGALALHMAREYGAHVRAFNVSREQLTFARERAAREGLTGRVEFIDDDYRNVTGTCDVFVSVGMLEHVGLRQFHALSDVIGRTLKRDGGRGLLHFIGRDAPTPLNAWIRRRIFPGAYPPTLSEVATRVLAPAGMSILDVENLRLHYARTLEHWYERFAAARDQARASFSEEFARAWELYLAGSRAAFVTGWLQLFQVVFAPLESAPPTWVRAAIYKTEATG